MKNPNLLTVLMIITLLLSAASLSIVAAQNDQSILRFKDYSDQIQPQIPDNFTLSNAGDEVLYASDDGSQPQRDPLPDVPGAEDANLIASNISDESNFPLKVAVIVLSVIVGVLAVFACYTKFFENKN
jgi:hypothetical protein